jgi:hypothetical protein
MAESKATVPHFELEVEVDMSEAVALRVLAVRANNPSLALIDLEAGTVTHYPPGRHALPRDAVDGAVITPRAETIVWTNDDLKVLSFARARRLIPTPQ